MQIYKPAKFANFVHICITRGKLIPQSKKRYQFSVRNTKSIQNLQTLKGHIFHTLQHFATKLFNAVIMNFTISMLLKILHIMQLVQ